jgi:hypothetical protein
MSSGRRKFATVEAAFDSLMTDILDSRTLTIEEQVDRFEILLDEFKADIPDGLNRLLYDTFTPLMRACDNGNLELEHYILSKEPNMKLEISSFHPGYTVADYYGRCIAARAAKQERNYKRTQAAIEKAYHDSVTLVGGDEAVIEQSLYDLVGDVDEEELANSVAFAEALVEAAPKTKTKSKTKRKKTTS